MKILREGNPNHYRQSYRGSVTCIWCASQLEYGYDDIKLSYISWATRRPPVQPEDAMALWTEEEFVPPEFCVQCPVCHRKIKVEVEPAEYALEIYQRYVSMDVYK